jgi:tRNA threonylcarbamoyladenosine biosynthesis protein TsaE
MNHFTAITHHEIEMRELGKKLALHANKLHLIFLQGDLGAGKTTFIRGFLEGLGHEGSVKSPTYTLVETYPMGSRTIHHFDLYRLHEALGIRDYFGNTSLCLMEWPERAEKILPTPDIQCVIAIMGEMREITMTAHTTEGQEVIQWLSAVS